MQYRFKIREGREIRLIIKAEACGRVYFSRGFRNKEVIHELIRDNIPVILLSESQPYSSVTTVTVDNFLGGYELAAHLISLGHTRIAVVAEDNASSRERIRGYSQALQESDLDVHEGLIVVTDSTAESAQTMASSLLQSSNPPTAIICCNDILAIGALLAAREKHVQVPEELSITGFDNTLLSKSSDPPLTTVEVPVQSMCSQAVDLLIGEIEGKASEKQKILVLPKLIVRKSTSCLR